MSNRDDFVYQYKRKSEQFPNGMTVFIGIARGYIESEQTFTNGTKDMVQIWLEFDELRKMVDAMDNRLRELGK